MSTTTIADKFVRCDDFASRLDGTYLPNAAWAVFAHLEQPVSVEEISHRLQQPAEAVMESITTLSGHGLIRKHLLNWREFLAQSGVAGSGEAAPARAIPNASVPVAAPPPPLAPAPVVVEPRPDEAPASQSNDVWKNSVHDEEADPSWSQPAAIPPVVAVAPEVQPFVAPAPVPEPAPRVSASTVQAPSRADPETVLPVSFAIVNEKARIERRATAAMTISFSLSNVAPAAPTSWKLNPLLKAIAQKAGGGLPGQLLVYRVFIHVPAALMHAAGIQSISLVDDSVVIRDRAFFDALCQAARVVASIDLNTVKA